jgi:hypothetical protein
MHLALYYNGVDKKPKNRMEFWQNRMENVEALLF